MLAITDSTTYEAERVIVAAGTGSGELAATLGVHLPCFAELLQMCITETAEPLLHHLVQHASRALTMKQLYTG